MYEKDMTVFPYHSTTLSSPHYTVHQLHLFQALADLILPNFPCLLFTVTARISSDQAPASENTSWGNQPLGSAVRELLLKPRRYSYAFLSSFSISALKQCYLVAVRVPSNPSAPAFQSFHIRVKPNALSTPNTTQPFLRASPMTNPPDS